MTFLHTLTENFIRFKNRPAFYIRERFQTYDELRCATDSVIRMIRNTIPGEQKTIGVVPDDDLQTYASILGIWLTGNIVVPLSRKNPDERNREIIRLGEIRFVVSSGTCPEYLGRCDDITILNSRESFMLQSETDYYFPPAGSFLYIVFTSGSTGVPKGVPVSMKNLQAFLDGYMASGFDFTPEDRFLQMYDIAFDASIPCYLVPLLVGACVFTVSGDEIKYIYALKLMMEQDLTVVKMPASSIAYLKQYFDRIMLKKLRYCILGGESLSKSLVERWRKCIPGAVIINAYGPTEITVNCMLYRWNTERPGKQLNDVVAIGRPFGDSVAIVMDDQHNILGPGQKGELYVSGNQVVNGYWKAPGLSDQAFATLYHNGRQKRFYRTGDIVKTDEEGDFLFCGRIDEQVKIDSYRVELGDIEKITREHPGVRAAAAVAIQTPFQTKQIHLFVEVSGESDQDLAGYLESKLPYYMLPEKIHYRKELPLTVGGKVNKEQLRAEC